MLDFLPTPTGGIGQPPRPSRPLHANPCRNDHRNPERAGDCNCADLAQEEAERRCGTCGWGSAEECHASARRCAEAGESYLCKLHRVSA